MKTPSPNHRQNPQKPTRIPTKEPVKNPPSPPVKTNKPSVLLSPGLLNATSLAAFVLFVLYMTAGSQPDLLWKMQDLDFFSYDSNFFGDMMHRVGGLAMYAGSFMYQFFYHPWLGSVLLTLFLLLTSLFAAKVFDLKGHGLSLAFLPSLALLWTLTDLGYLLYFQKVDGYLYSNLFGVMAALAGLWAYRRIRASVWKSIFGLAYMVVAYPAFGTFALLGSLLMALSTLVDPTPTGRTGRILPLILLPVGILLIPYMHYLLVFDDLPLPRIYLANLMHFKTEPSEQFHWAPFALLLLALSVLTLFGSRVQAFAGQGWERGVPALVVLATTALVWTFSFKDANFNTEIGMLRAAGEERWSDVLSLARKQKDEPTRLIVMSTNLALYKQGLAMDKMFHYPNGNKQPASVRPIVPAHMAGTMLYYEYGILNYSYKWCMEGMVEFGPTVSVVKYFVLNCLLKGEYALASKYNRLLLSTLYHRSWAKEMQSLIDHPERIKTSGRFQNILTLNEFDDNLDGDYYDAEQFLRNHFGNMRTSSPELAGLSVLFNLERKDIERFWPMMFQWVRLNPGKHIPVHVQEAALLYANVIHHIDLSGAPFDKDVIDQFAEFSTTMRQSAGYPEETLGQICKSRFGNSYWMYYFFVKDKQPAEKED